MPGDYDDVAARSGLVVAGVYVYRIAQQGGGLTNVHGLAQSLALVNIDQHNLVGDILQGQCERRRGANAAGADYRDLSVSHNAYLLF